MHYWMYPSIHRQLQFNFVISSQFSDHERYISPWSKFIWNLKLIVVITKQDLIKLKTAPNLVRMEFVRPRSIWTFPSLYHRIRLSRIIQRCTQSLFKFINRLQWNFFSRDHIYWRSRNISQINLKWGHSGFIVMEELYENSSKAEISPQWSW